VARSPSDPPEESAEPWADDPVSPWIEQLQAGIDSERNAERIFEHFYPRLCHYFYRRGLEAERSKDLAQDVLAGAFENLGSFERRSRFARWLFSIAHSHYANEVRRNKTAKRNAFEMPLQEEWDDFEDGEGRRSAPALAAHGPSPEEEALRHERTAELHAAVEALPPQMRQCVRLRILHDLKYREIAEVLQVSVDTVKSQIGNAKVRLREILAGGADTALSRLEDES
jgi:RNA polymerase sigma-70 factor (ECF subfamily)